MNSLIAKSIVENLRATIYRTDNGNTVPLLSECPVCGAKPGIRQGRNTTKFKAEHKKGCSLETAWADSPDLVAEQWETEVENAATKK